jgi:hypothetical protein
MGEARAILGDGRVRRARATEVASIAPEFREALEGEIDDLLAAR